MGGSDQVREKGDSVTKDEILQALHMVAMGRPRHPFAEQLAEKLAECFAEHHAAPSLGNEQFRAMLDAMPVARPLVSAVASIPIPAGTSDPVQAVKRGPGRPKKAE